MTVFRTRATIGEDHRLVIELPEDLPCGPAEVTVEVGVETSPDVDHAELSRRTLEDARREAERMKGWFGGEGRNLGEVARSRGFTEEERLAAAKAGGARDYPLSSDDFRREEREIERAREERLGW